MKKKRHSTIFNLLDYFESPSSRTGPCKGFDQMNRWRSSFMVKKSALLKSPGPVGPEMDNTWAPFKSQPPYLMALDYLENSHPLIGAFSTLGLTLGNVPGLIQHQYPISVDIPKKDMSQDSLAWNHTELVSKTSHDSPCKGTLPQRIFAIEAFPIWLDPSYRRGVPPPMHEGMKKKAGQPKTWRTK